MDNEFEFMFQTKCQPSEIGALPYWKFESFIERLNKKNEEEKDRQRKQEEQQKKQQQQQSKGQPMNPKQYMPKFRPPKY